MKLFIVLFYTFLATNSYADYCHDSDAGMNPQVAGKVVYSLGGENCLGGTCYSQMIKEFDRCLSDREVLEFSCEQNLMTEKKMTCSSEQVCDRGACVKR